MSNITHINDTNRPEVKDFEFVSATELLKFQTRHLPSERTPVPASSHLSFAAFHEEFKSLVLASNEPSQEDLAAAVKIDLFEPHELEWDEMPEEAASNRASVAPVAVTPGARQQTVKPLAGPCVGTPMPIETWVVKTIAVLVGLNLLFAGMIVTGVRVRDLFQ